MTYRKVHIAHLHIRAISDEIGERIRTDPDRKPAPLSPRLIGLMKRLRDRPSNSTEPGA